MVVGRPCRRSRHCLGSFLPSHSYPPASRFLRLFGMHILTVLPQLSVTAARRPAWLMLPGLMSRFQMSLRRRTGRAAQLVRKVPGGESVSLECHRQQSEMPPALSREQVDRSLWVEARLSDLASCWQVIGRWSRRWLDSHLRLSASLRPWTNSLNPTLPLMGLAVVFMATAAYGVCKWMRPS